jgi:hypothetical protein
VIKNLIARVREVWARVRAYNPARLAEGVRLLLVALVGAGWLTIDDARINAAVTVVGVLASLFATERVRSNVTPVAKLDGCTACLAHDPVSEG